MVRKFDLNKDYQTISKWLKDHSKPNVPKDLLSDSGFMVDEIIAGFLYKTNSKICYIENFISNPFSEKSKRREAINTLFKTIIKEAQDLNFKFMMTSVELNSLHKNLIELGFTEVPGKSMFRSL